MSASPLDRQLSQAAASADLAGSYFDQGKPHLIDTEDLRKFADGGGPHPKSQQQFNYKFREDLTEGRYSQSRGSDRVSIEPSVRVGVMGNAGMGDNSPMMGSPYTAAQIAMNRRGAIDTMAKLSLGGAIIHSQKFIPGATGTEAQDLESPAAGDAPSPWKDIWQPWISASAYADSVLGFRLARNLGASIYAGGDAWAMMSGLIGVDTHGLGEGNAGAALAWLPSANNAVHAALNIQGELGTKDFYRNIYGRGTPGGILGGYYATLDYIHYFSPGVGAKLAVQAILKNHETQINPSISVFNDKASLAVEAHRQKPKGPNGVFFADERGVRVTAQYQPTDWLAAGLDDSIMETKYATADSPQYTLTGFLKFVFGDGTHRTSVIAGHTAASGPGVFDPAATRRWMSDNIPLKVDSYNLTRSLVMSSPNYAQFVSNSAAKIDTYGQLLGIGAAVGDKWSASGYNNDEDASHPNLDSQDSIYTGFTSLMLDPTGKLTAPLGVCTTQSLYLARYFNDVARLKGWTGVRCMPTGFGVPDGRGVEGHTNVLCRGADGMVTFQDWDHAVPIKTGSTNVYEAYRIYQAFTGVVTPFWYFIDPDTGRQLASVFTPEGREMVEALTVLDEASSHGKLWDNDPRGNKITMKRALESAERAALSH